MKSCRVLLGALLAVLLASQVLAQALPSPPGGCDFDVGVDLFANENGRFTMSGLGTEPTLELQLGYTYTFCQIQETNWFHPLAFAYLPPPPPGDRPGRGPDGQGPPGRGPDGTRPPRGGPPRGLARALPGIGAGLEAVYYIDGVEVSYDEYRIAFSIYLELWSPRRFWVTITPTDYYAPELLYVCGVHANMRGRITVRGAIQFPVPLPTPPPPTAPIGIDELCGTFNVTGFERDSEFCEMDEFYCTTPGIDPTFDRCMHAINCKMMVDMTVRTTPGDPVAFFMHQMIPHHQMAVSQSKIMLKLGLIGADPEVESLMRGIINNQNAQISFMRQWLADRELPTSEEAICWTPENPAVERLRALSKSERKDFFESSSSSSGSDKSSSGSDKSSSGSDKSD